MSFPADLPLTGASIVQIQRNDDNLRVTTQEIADLTGLDGTETVRVIRGKRWAITTVADIAGGINGSDVVTIRQGNRHVRTTAQSIADLGGGAYVGPLDLVPGAVVAYGPRALSAAWLGQPLFTLRRDSDEATLSFNADAVTGEAPVASITAWLAGANGFMTVWNDQSGNADDAVQEEPTKQPSWVASLTNSKPGITIADGLLLATAGNTSQGADVAAFVVGRCTNTTGQRSMLGVNGGSGNDWIDFYQDTGTITLMLNDASDNLLSATCVANNSATLGNFFLVDGSLSASARTLRLNGALLAVNTENGTITPWASRFVVGDDDVDGGSEWAGNLLEVIKYPALSDPNALAIRQNIATYYGLTI